MDVVNYKQGMVVVRDIVVVVQDIVAVGREVGAFVDPQLEAADLVAAAPAVGVVGLVAGDPALGDTNPDVALVVADLAAVENQAVVDQVGVENQVVKADYPTVFVDLRVVRNLGFELETDLDSVLMEEV